MLFFGYLILILNSFNITLYICLIDSKYCGDVISKFVLCVCVFFFIIHLFSKHLLSAYCMSGNLLRAGDSVIKMVIVSHGT